MPVSGMQLSTRRLSEVARHVVIPSGIVTTGWPAVEKRCNEFGDRFDKWQQGAGQVILGKRADGLYAATVGGVTLSIPRQVAKTWLVGRIIVALCIEFPGLKVLWTAHRTRTATNTFRSLQSFVKRKKVLPYLMPTANNGIRQANGEQEIAFQNGSIIMFGAREAGFGRGFDVVDVEVFDEAQILTEKALEDMVAATNQTQHKHGALLFYMGTPPRPVDHGEAFTIRRTDALAHKPEGSVFGEPTVGDDAVYIECSADPDADPDDRVQWARANPSYPHRTPLPSMLRLRKNLPSVESWMREALGIWDDPDTLHSAIPNWDDLADKDAVVDSHRQWALAMSPDRKWAAIGLAGRTTTGQLYVAWKEHQPGAGWIVPAVVDIWSEKRIPIRIHKSGPEAAFISPLREAGVEVVEVSSAEVAQATGQIIDAATNREVTHPGQWSLSAAVKVAVLRMSTDGAVLWSQRSTEADITTLQAITIAAGGVPAIAEFAGSFTDLNDDEWTEDE